MSETNLENIFNAAILSLSTPENAFSLPTERPGPSEWLQKLVDTIDRKLAYFDEILSAYLVLRIPSCDPPDEEGRPPTELITFLTLLQVGFDASYISPKQEPVDSVPEMKTPRLLGPPPAGRPGTKPKIGSPLKPKPPPLVPPQTPNPTPQMEDSDRQYAVAEGVQLHTFIWGDATPGKDARKDEFGIIWNQKEKEWIIIYRMDVTIVFLKTRVPDPLLSLTVSITLREKPLSVTPARRAIFDLLHSREDEASTPTQAHPPPVGPSSYLDNFGDLEEVNLLDGLSSSTTFGTEEDITLPTTRVASIIRRQAYWLPPLRTKQMAPIPSPTTARTSRPILRKAFRKTLHTCNGFGVRMRTIFVPYVLVPGVGDDDEERRQAGSEERSVVLCVEIENTGESSKDFEVESVKVNVSGEGATSHLICWGESLARMQPESVFPLRLRPMEQYNLLYSVTFLHPTDANDPIPKFGSAPPPAASGDLHRSVSIVIRGRPCDVTGDKVSYPTDAFNSKWNCLLNLASNQYADVSDYQLNEPLVNGDALPTPASPFPVSSPRLQVEFEKSHPISAAQASVVGGSKRHTVSGLSGRRNTIPSPIKVRFSLPAGVTATSTPSTSGPRITTTAASPGMHNAGPMTPTTPGAYSNTPVTPAYPMWSPDAQTVPPTPYLQAPMMGQVGSMVGQIVEPHRDRRMAPSGSLLPTTPGPSAYGASIPERLANLEPYADPVVVSVALLPPSEATGGSRKAEGLKKDWIYPLDIFALEIFVFNQSPVTRRFEVAFPDKKRHRRQLMDIKRRSNFQEGPSSNHRLVGDALSRIGSQAGILPLENRIRIGYVGLL
ncbi:hypothetical protein FRC17_009424 [Serendipita sp. 399]|nr:hypothetical protein FRC17_009424 [Serendipita sp. 399]